MAGKRQPAAEAPKTEPNPGRTARQPRPERSRPAGDLVADVMERTHATVLAAIQKGHEDAGQAMRAAEEAVAAAVEGVADAVRLAQQSTNNPKA
jgi:hypothetical protein